MRAQPAARTYEETMTKRRELTCDDCYFRRETLCAMTPATPCPTFRLATRSLVPPPQPRLVPLATFVPQHA
jgi:hypothetical protein